MMSQTRVSKVLRSHEQRFWELIQTGLESSDAGFGAGLSGAWGEVVFRHAGGMTPRIVEHRSARFLTIHDREIIHAGVSRNDSTRTIAKVLGRPASTVLRELRRNQGSGPKYRPKRTTRPPRQDATYSPTLAQGRADRRQARPKPGKLQQNLRLKREVQTRLQLGYSPEQIMQRLRMDFPGDPEMQISHESIYRSIYVQGKGELRKELAANLRSGKAQRMPRERARRRHSSGAAGKIPGMVLISERPAEIEDRAVPGHWEGDLIIGKEGKSQIGTLVERATRFTMLLHLPQKRDALTVGNEMIRQMGRLPAHLRLSVTWDQGKEMADHVRVAAALDLRDGVFFCDPHSPWQRGTNENTNGLLRQYFPKGTDLSGYSQDYLDAVAAELNGRPRKTLEWWTPAEALGRLLDVRS